MPYLRLLLLACVVAWLPGCDNTPDTDEPAPEGALTVLPVGDSRVQGARPRFESYRYELWKNFVSDDQPVDFVGPLDDEASYPGFQGRRFDDDHAGVGGFTTLDVLNSFDEIQGSLDEAPGVVLLGIGGNDLLSNRTPEETFASLNEIIDRFQAAHPNATIIVEQIAPGLSRFMTAERQRVFDGYNALIETLPANQTTATSTILLVNMAEDWEDRYMADNVHYNEAGAKAVADRYYEVIDATFFEVAQESR